MWRTIMEIARNFHTKVAAVRQILRKYWGNEWDDERSLSTLNDLVKKYYEEKAKIEKEREENEARRKMFEEEKTKAEGKKKEEGAMAMEEAELPVVEEADEEEEPVAEEERELWDIYDPFSGGV